MRVREFDVSAACSGGSGLRGFRAGRFRGNRLALRRILADLHNAAAV